MESQHQKQDIRLPDETLIKWQEMVNTLAEIIGVPTALIRAFDGPQVQVLCASKSGNNPYKQGETRPLAGLYCEKVIATRDSLLISNAREHLQWASAPDTQLGMISYLGYPLLWPDGEIFGTISVLDRQPRRFQASDERLLSVFKDFVEAYLASLYKDLVDAQQLESTLDSLTEGIIVHDAQRRIQFFNKAAQHITGYSKEDVVGKDCHTVFGEPFCGNRCSFDQGSPDRINSLYYPLNIRTKSGEPRRIEMAMSGRRDVAGNLVGVIASFRDVTDLVGFKIQLGELKGFAGIVGRTPKMLKVYGQIRDMGTNDYSVHITGETGTGKELVAMAIHHESRRGGGPFVPVNCAALPEGILESELFGHVKGAFTGALRDKKGRFALANNGTLFLDEVADLPKVVQAKLLRVLQEGKFERVGSEQTTSVDVRIISATNRDLKDEVKKGNFREDLFYRINVVPIDMPPLRERKDDIPLLLDHFFHEAKQEGQNPPALSKEALKMLIDYPWPGNVRELQSAIRFALVKSRGRIIQPGHLPIELKERHKQRPTRGPARKLDQESVRAALIRSGGNKAKAARLLGVGRATLYRFLADFPHVS